MLLFDGKQSLRKLKSNFGNSNRITIDDDFYLRKNCSIRAEGNVSIGAKDIFTCEQNYVVKKMVAKFI